MPGFQAIFCWLERRRSRKKVGRKGNLRRISIASLLMRNVFFFLAFIQSLRIKQVSHGFLLDKMEICRLTRVRKFRKLNNHMYGMFSWINIRLEEKDLLRTSGFLPSFVWTLGWYREDMNDMLIKHSGFLKLESRANMLNNRVWI